MTAPEYDGSVRPPLPHGSRRALDDPGTPTARHRERQRGESYPDALSRVAGERDAALRDVARLERELNRLAGLRIEELEQRQEP